MIWKNKGNAGGETSLEKKKWFFTADVKQGREGYLPLKPDQQKPILVLFIW